MYEVDGDEDEDFEPPIFVSKSRKETEDAPVETAPSGENWDDEIEDIEIPVDNPYKFQDIYVHPAPKTLAEAGYTVDSHLFLPYDMHSQPFVRQKYIYPIEEGQFDDNSDENTDEIWL